MPTDMLVPLYNLPPRSEGETALADQGIVIRRANTFEISAISDFIRKEFSQGWVDETIAVFGRQPIPVFVALEKGKMLGFATVDSTRRGYFGPTGVAKEQRGRGIGKALLITALWGLWDLGYAYAIIGAAGPVEFYEKTVNAVAIPNSWPGIYGNQISRE